MLDGDDLSGFTSGRYPLLHITYEMPLDAVVSFDPNQLQVIDLDTGRHVAPDRYMRLWYREDSLLGKFLWMHDTQVIEDTGKLDPSKNANDPLLGKPVDYLEDVYFPDPVPERFDVILPDMKIDGTPYPGLLVHFQKHLGVFCVFMLVGNYNIDFIR